MLDPETPLSEIKLSIRTRNILMKEGATKAGDVFEMDARRLAEIPWCGSVVREEIMRTFFPGKAGELAERRKKNEKRTLARLIERYPEEAQVLLNKQAAV